MSTVPHVPFVATPRPGPGRAPGASHPRRRGIARPPAARWELAGAAGCDAEACARVLDALDALPRESWLALGRRVAADDRAAGDRAAALAALEAIVSARRLAVTAWLVGDAVETAAHLAPCAVASTGGRRSSSRPDTVEERALLIAARQAAAGGALAYLVRPWLAPALVTALLAPLRATMHASRFRIPAGAAQSP